MDLIIARTVPDKRWGKFVFEKQKTWAVGELSADLYTLIKSKDNWLAIDNKRMNEKIRRKAQATDLGFN